MDLDVRTPVREIHRYSQAISKQVEEYYLEGFSLHAISLKEGMPCYASLLRWYAENEEFRSRIDRLNIAMAMHHRDQALEEALSPASKDDVPAARLAFDAHVWAAEKADPQRYGKQTNTNTSVSGNVVIHVSTGVPERDIKHVVELNADGTVKKIGDRQLGDTDKIAEPAGDDGIRAEVVSEPAAQEAKTV